MEEMMERDINIQEAESEKTNTIDTLITDENADEFKMLNLLSKKNDMKTMMDGLRKEQNKLIKDVDKAEIIDERLSSLTLDEIEKLTDEQIEEIYTIDGEPFELTISFDSKSKETEFKKDFLVFMKKSSDTMEQFDKEMEKIEKEIAENQEEFDRVVSTFGNMSNLIRSKLVEKRDTATDESKKELYTELIREYDYGFTLENVKEFYSNKNRARNVLGDYKNDKRSTYLYRRYMKVMSALRVKTDLAQFAGLENKFLSEDHQKHPNIFMFAIISMVASWKNENLKNKGLFLTQFAINIKNLYYNNFDKEEDRAKFISNIIEVMDLID
jgi:hypothetical protein